MYYYSGGSSLFVCTLLARASMSKLKCQIHQLIMDFVPGKVTLAGIRTLKNLPAFSCSAHKLHTSTGVCRDESILRQHFGNRGKICEFSGEPPATSLEQSY